jgi:hypothetical protein
MSFYIEHRDRDQVKTFLLLLDSVLELKSCAYVAGPLDSGKDYYERLAAGQLSPQVRLENEGRLSKFVAGLRRRLEYPVIDPGPLRVPTWDGRDHGIFFLQVVHRYARECWFLNGWEYSTGATAEFVFCSSTNMPCLSESGEPLTARQGLELIRTAADAVLDLGLDDTKLRSRVESLASFVSHRE